ncbi:MAG TPA: MerR family transcriptional regulator [Candidatus Acidoferrales bacterium]|nr:MerR family transcriptional regulator [Candidatus Acidoferrales bacterium]
MAAEPTTELLSSGEFARRSRLSAKALRIYDEIGLLPPVDVELSNRYRRYGVDQLPTASLIAMLCGIDMSLAEIGSLLADLGRGPELPTERLTRHLVELDARHTSRRSLVRHIHAILREEDRPMFTIQTRHVPARRMLSIQRRLRAFETDAFVVEAKSVFAEHLSGAPPIGPFSLVFHGVVDHDSDGPREATLACSDEVEPTELIGIRTEAAHDEAFTTITKAQWAYPAILAAYDAVACSPEVSARNRSPLSCREGYLAEADAISEGDLICDSGYPLGGRTGAR